MKIQLTLNVETRRHGQVEDKPAEADKDRPTGHQMGFTKKEVENG